MSFKTKDGETLFNTAYNNNLKHWPVAYESLVFHYKFKTKPVIPAVIPKEKLKTIQVPVLMLMGEEEVIYDPKKAVSSAKECIPHMDVKMVTQASHCLFIEQADLVNQYMADFLQ